MGIKLLFPTAFDYLHKHGQIFYIQTAALTSRVSVQGKAHAKTAPFKKFNCSLYIIVTSLLGCAANKYICKKKYIHSKYIHSKYHHCKQNTFLYCN